MNTGVAAAPLSKSWKELYKAALFETDRNKLSERIAHAEWALSVRARELFHTGREHLQERRAVDTAIYTLNILRSCTTWEEEGKQPKRCGATNGRAA